MLGEHVRMDSRGERILADARRSALMSARGEHRVLRVARTLADLERRERVTDTDLATALSLRCERRPAGVRPA